MRSIRWDISTAEEAGANVQVVRDLDDGMRPAPLKISGTFGIVKDWAEGKRAEKCYSAERCRDEEDEGGLDQV
jgi:hypothetical protein